MSLVHKNKVSKEFINKVKEISLKLQINPNWLMVVIELETAGTFSASITNSLGYTGLIQFGKDTAISLGTTTDELRVMTEIEQLDWVYKYLRPYRKKMNNLADVYLAVFFPRAIGKPDGWALQTKRLTPERIAKWNPLFDINKDKQIQVWEIKTKLFQRVPDEYKFCIL